MQGKRKYSLFVLALYADKHIYTQEKAGSDQKPQGTGAFILLGFIIFGAFHAPICVCTLLFVYF